MRLTLALLSCAMPAVAQDISLALPIDCTLGDSCYIQNYVDHDPTEGASDFQCGVLTYDGHKGTDFGLISLTAMEDGVDVLAAAAGTVRGVRNDMRDVLYTLDLAGEINGRDCGNGVVVVHDNGWETQYCHMRMGSVSVLPGDIVETGDVLGLVGLSGRTQFPHVHISVRQGGQMVDPFAPEGQTDCNAAPVDGLWDASITTPTGGLLATGFSAKIPNYAAVKAGTAAAQTLMSDAPIVLWAFAFGAQAGDVMTLSIEGPGGPLFETEDVLDRQQALFMRAGGLNPPDVGFPAGNYTGTAIQMRDGVELDRQITVITLP
ncbi:M23 family metallopeptidase [Octadecabacter sp. G9-8]|uniref:M23 family metallopeptidase n=1 Tax=Octadecabacter dasysiphoniae TaxID=2909341 RepID=A0ABS9CR82_9RHOB|nr:M23 family metallopeptidase [Octadecabacter dasysiphoniae]MCF2869698.1 M23 family metallopeptidase [Octadecabacter dasysiphoniae]